MKAVVTVIGKDMVGILAKVSTTCAEANANVIEVTQSVLQEYFCMVMLIDITQMNCDIEGLRKRLEENVPSMTVHVMHEDIFNSMHRPAPDSPPQGNISSANKMFCAKIAVNCENWKQCLTLKCF